MIVALSPGFAVGSQIAPEDLDGIAAAGFRGIVNNRPDGEEPGQPPAADIEAEAKRLGLAYRHIPVLPGLLTEAQARELRAFAAETGGPVLAFCRSGTRSAHLWQLAQRLW